MSKLLKIERNKTSVVYKQERDGYQGQETADVTCHEAPLESFDDAMQALVPVVLAVLETTKSWAKGIKIAKVDFKHTKAGTRSAKIYLTKSLNKTGDHPLKTPTVQFDHPAEGEDQPREVSEENASLLAALYIEAEKYIKGDRQQILLPLDGDGNGQPASDEDDNQSQFPE